MAEKKPIVVKMDGREEPFDRNKVKKSIMNAGASEEVAEEITRRVEEYVKGRDKITSREIRRKVFVELRKEDPQAAANWAYYDRLVKGRITFEDGKFIIVPKGAKVYLGWQVRDIPPPGLSHVDEVKGILEELEEDLKMGIPRRTIHSRTWVLFHAVLKTKKMKPEDKLKAIELINEFRKKLGWKPFKLKYPVT